MKALCDAIRSVLSRIGASRGEELKTYPRLTSIVTEPIVTCYVRRPGGVWIPLESKRPPPGGLSGRRKHAP
jgi:hypothetical protein